MLRFCIEKNLPGELRLQNANRYVIEGWAFGSARIKKVLIRIGNNVYKAGEFEIFRPDVYDRYCDSDPNKLSLFSGFCVPITLHPVSRQEVHSVQLIVSFRGGKKEVSTIGSVSLLPWRPMHPEYPLPENTAKDDLLVICMATYNPKKQQFQRQVESIINQDLPNWICIVNDDCSSPEAKAFIREVVSVDERFFFFENQVNLGFYNNFERCLERVPPYAKYVALSDQDDFWYPDKLRRCVEAFADNIQLVYCDMKVVGESGEVTAGTFWRTRRNYFKSEDIDLLCIKNTVTGAASVFRAGLLDKALPFPQRCGNVYHDHWIAVVAAASGGVEYVDEALYEYIQSDVNVTGYADSIQKKHYTYFEKIRLAESEYQQIRGFSFFARQSARLKLHMTKFVGQMVHIYGFLHKNARNIVTVVEALRTRDVDRRYIQIANRAISVRGLVKIFAKARRKNETLDHKPLFLMLSILMNRFVKAVVIPLRGFVVRLVGEDKARAFFAGKDSLSDKE